MASEKPTTKDFRLRASRVHLTYKNHLPKDEVRALWATQCGEEIYIAHENADPGHPYEHTHVLLRFIKLLSTRDSRYFDFGDIHPHILAVRSADHWRNCLGYLSKEDPENASLAQFKKTMADVVWEHESVQDALRDCHHMRDVTATVALYAHKPIPVPECLVPETGWYPWQAGVLALCNSPPDDRHIHWYTDYKGAAGKSFLARWLAINMKALLVKYFGKTSDFMTLVEGALRNHTWNGRIFIADLPRDAENKHLYEPLEALKDGVVQTTKYQGTSRQIVSPHVIVFANFPPNRAKMSADRWITTEVSKGSVKGKEVVGDEPVPSTSGGDAPLNIKRRITPPGKEDYDDLVDKANRV